MENTSNETFAHRLTRLMKAKGLSQSDLATKSGLERSEINRLVNGRRPPKAHEILWLHPVLEVTAAELMDGLAIPPQFQRMWEKGQAAVQRVLTAEAREAEALARNTELESQLETERTERAADQLTADQQLAQARSEATAKLTAEQAKSATAEAAWATERADLVAKNKRLAGALGVANASQTALHQQLTARTAELTKARTDAPRAAIATGIFGALIGAALSSSSDDSA